MWKWRKILIKKGPLHHFVHWDSLMFFALEFSEVITWEKKEMVLLINWQNSKGCLLWFRFLEFFYTKRRTFLERKNCVQVMSEPRAKCLLSLSLSLSLSPLLFYDCQFSSSLCFFTENTAFFRWIEMMERESDFTGGCVMRDGFATRHLRPNINFNYLF